MHGKVIGMAHGINPGSMWRQNAEVGFSLTAKYIQNNWQRCWQIERSSERAYLGIRSDPLCEKLSKFLKLFPIPQRMQQAFKLATLLSK